jgi:hypothetical protein
MGEIDAQNMFKVTIVTLKRHKEETPGNIASLVLSATIRPLLMRSPLLCTMPLTSDATYPIMRFA